MHAKHQYRWSHRLGTIAGIAIVAALALSVWTALASAQSLTGGTQYEAGPPAHNAYLYHVEDDGTGKSRTGRYVLFGEYFVRCGSVVEGEKVKCGKFARITTAIDKFGRALRKLKPAKFQKLVGVDYGYHTPSYDASAIRTDWFGAIKRWFPLRTQDTLDGETVNVKLGFISALLYDERFQDPKPNACLGGHCPDPK